MISGNDERIAFVIETEARLDGIRQTRSEMAGLLSSTDIIDAGLKRWNQTATVSTGTMKEFAEQVNRDIVALKTLAQTVDRSSQEEVRAVRSAIGAQLALSKEYGATGRQLQQLTKIEYDFEASLVHTGTQLERISPKAQRAGNAMSILSLSAAGLTGGTQGAINAAGSLTSSLALLTTNASLAAGAYGLGALVAVGGALYAVLDNIDKKVGDLANKRLTRLLSRIPDESIDAVVSGAQSKRDAALKAYESAGRDVTYHDGQVIFGKKQRQFEEADAQLSMALERQLDIHREHGRELAREADADRKRAVEKAREHAKAVENAMIQSQERIFAMRTRVSSINEEYGGGGRGEQGAALLEARAATQAKLRELDRNELLGEQEKQRERLAIIAEGEANAAAIRGNYARKEAKERDDAERASAKRRQAIALGFVKEAVNSQQSIAQTLKRLALEPIVSELEGLAAREAVKALTSWPNVPAMAKHAAGAALATAAAREVSGWAGGGTKGSHSGASGGGGGYGGGTFEPRTGADNNGTMNFTIITQNAMGPDHIQNLAYQLNRAGVMKRPLVQLPATTGITVSAN